MKYRIDVLRNYVPVGEIPAESCSIKYSSTAKIKRGASVSGALDNIRMFSNTEFSIVGDRISPVLIDDEGNDHRMGVFMVVASPRTVDSARNTDDLELYDESYILDQSAFDTRHYWPAGTSYTTVFSQILTEAGINRQSIEPSSLALTIAREFPVGDNMLQTLNMLLDEINYDQLHMDGNGYAMCTKKKEPLVPDFIYRDDANSIIVPGMTDTVDIYGVPNVFIGLVSNPDQSVMTAKAENHNLNSDLSIERRGYKLTKIYKLDSVASQNELDAYVNRLMSESMMVTDRVSVSTAPEYDHDFRNAVQIDTEEISGLYIETAWDLTFGTGQAMSHTLERRVFQ